MKQLINYTLHLLICCSASAQTVTVVSKGSDSENSYYDVARIGSNEYWAAGENGVLDKIDTLGNITSISANLNKESILRIQRVDSIIYLTSLEGSIFITDLDANGFKKISPPEFNGKCIYDILPLKDGNLLLCGGKSGIAMGEKKIPAGFIAVADIELKNVTIVWKSTRHFVWSLVQKDDQVMAAVFDGLNTKILQSNDFKIWKKERKIKGLVHDLSFIDNQIWFSGTKSINFKKDGIAGNDKFSETAKNTGCIWAIKKTGDQVVGVTYTGEILFVYDSLEIESYKIPGASTLYEVATISNKKFIVVGHGSQAYILDFNTIQIN